jgi:hypothetical protein
METQIINSSKVNVVGTCYVRETMEKVITRMELVDLTRGGWEKWDTWTSEQVKQYYESFWNDLNTKSYYIVKVDLVLPV